MTQDNPHWKQFHNPDYIGAYALEPGQELVVTINSVGTEDVIGSNGKKEPCMVIRFAEKNIKPMICNVTNAKLISKVAGSPRVNDWKGVRIQLYAAVVNAFGDEVEALRVRPKAPKVGEKAKMQLSPGNTKWNEVVRKIANGTDIETVEKHFIISDDDKELLYEEVAELYSAADTTKQNKEGAENA